MSLNQAIPTRLGLRAAESSTSFAAIISEMYDPRPVIAAFFRVA